MTTPKEERTEFEKILRNVFEKTPDYQTMRTIFQNLYEVQIETADDPELVKIGKKEIKHALTLAEISGSGRCGDLKHTIRRIEFFV